MSARYGAKVIAVAVGCGLVAALVFAFAASRPELVSLGTVAGGPPYEWNQPFLDWPQAGDLPCETEDGPCGTPYPKLDAATKLKGKSLEIAELKVDVGKPGRHELPLGTLAFARGIHTRTFFKIANGDPKVYRVAQTHVEFRSLVPGAPPFREFVFDRAPVAGVEPVSAVLVWDVDWAMDGAVMEITDLVVE